MKTIILFLLTIVSNLSYAQKLYGDTTKTTLPSFDISVAESNNLNSSYYFKKVEDRFKSMDTTLTSREILSLTRFYASLKLLDPRILDSLSNIIYKLNEEKKYNEAISIAQLLLVSSPNNLTGHKEIALAYNKLNQSQLAKIYQVMMIKIIKAIFEFSDGSYEYPFIVNNYFEGISIYEAVFRCKPTKSALMLDKSKRLLGAYYGYSSRYDEILIKYSELSHWKHKLTKGEYIEEGSIDR